MKSLRQSALVAWAKYTRPATRAWTVSSRSKISKIEFTERFEREAKAISSLNHPNICTLYDVGPNYLVMEYIEGAPVKGPLPLDQTLKYAAQICDALDAAHKKGITHRDLKPANILVTKAGIKLLDFGLAKIGQTVKPLDDATLTMALTGKNEIVGTLYYMSPEQLQAQATGQEIDARSDIFSFGIVLYEMLTGKRAFEGSSPASVIAAIMERAAPSVADVAPPALDRLLRRCLEKDPENRWQTARDLKSALELAQFPVSTAVGEKAAPARRAPSLSRLGIAGWAVAGATLALLAVLLLVWPKSPAARPLERLSVDLGPDAHMFGSFTSAISPDGTRLLYIAGDGRKDPSRLALRRLDQTESTLLPGAIGGVPFFSADSQWIGIFSDSKVQKISVQGGGAIPLFDLPSFSGASWGANGFIVAARRDGGLLRVPDTGGTPQEITKLEASEQTHRWPQILPGGKAVLFTASDSTAAFEDARIKAVSLDTGAQKTIVRGGYFGRYIPTDGTGRAVGHLVYMHQRVLFAAPFDPARMELRGSPIPLIEDVAGFETEGIGHYSLSNDGTFVYLSGAAFVEKWPVELMDQTGKSQTLISELGQYRDLRFSPDGRKLAVSVIAEQGRDIYVYDPERGSMTRLTTKGRQNMTPVWAPDGKHLVYANGGGIFWIRSDGAGEPQQLTPSSTALPFSFSPDGHRLAYWEADLNANMADAQPTAGDLDPSSRFERSRTSQARQARPVSATSAVPRGARVFSRWAVDGVFFRGIRDSAGLCATIPRPGREMADLDRRGPNPNVVARRLATALPGGGFPHHGGGLQGGKRCIHRR